MKKIKLFFLGMLLFSQSCFVYQKDTNLSMSTNIKEKRDLKVILNSVQVSNDLLIIEGQGLSLADSIILKTNNLELNFDIKNKSDSQVRASAKEAISLLVGKTFDLIISNAEAQSSFSITFSLQNGAILPAHLSKVGASAGDILKYNGHDWVFSPLSNSQTYRGTWAAVLNGAGLDTSPNSGDYYIISSAGNYHDGSTTISFDVGDWIMFSDTTGKWEKVASGLSGKVSKLGDTITGDLVLDTLLKLKGGSHYLSLQAPASLAGNIGLTLPGSVGTAGQVLMTNGAGVLSWSSLVPTGAAGGDLSGSYPNPTISNLDASKIANGSVSSTHFQYLSGVTSNIQDQLNAKAGSATAISQLTGDVTTSGSGSVSATVVNVGGMSAANVVAGVNLVNSATSANTGNMLVRRDASGNFSAGTITATLNGSATNVSGTVGVANGGTGATSLALNNLLFGNGTGSIGVLATTATPSVLLSQNATGAPTWTTSTSGNFLKGGTGTGVSFGPILSSDLPSGTIIGSGTTNYIPYYNSSTTLANSPITVSGSNVGIGNVSPGYALDVTGPIKASAVGIGVNPSIGYPLQVAGETHLYQGTYFDPIVGHIAAVKMSQNADATHSSAPFIAGINGTAGNNFNTYGGYFNNTSTVSGTGKNYGIYVVGSNNYFSGDVQIAGLNTANSLRVSSKYGSENSVAATVLPSQGLYLAWNQSLGQGRTHFMNHRGLGGGGFEFNLFDAVGVYTSTPFSIDSNGNVGIGYTTAIAKLQVNGAIISAPSANNATSTVNFSNGNQQHTTQSCGAFDLHNLKDGGSYAFVVKGTTSALCSFNAFSNAGTTALTVHLPPNFGVTTNGSHTMFNFMVFGSDVYVSWTTGY